MPLFLSLSIVTKLVETSVVLALIDTTFIIMTHPLFSIGTYVGRNIASSVILISFQHITHLLKEESFAVTNDSYVGRHCNIRIISWNMSSKCYSNSRVICCNKLFICCSKRSSIATKGSYITTDGSHVAIDDLSSKKKFFLHLLTFAKNIMATLHFLNQL